MTRGALLARILDAEANCRRKVHLHLKHNNPEEAEATKKSYGKFITYLKQNLADLDKPVRVSPVPVPDDVNVSVFAEPYAGDFDGTFAGAFVDMVDPVALARATEAATAIVLMAALDAEANGSGQLGRH